MKALIREGFNRKYVLWPVLASIAFVVSAFFVTESRRFATRDLMLSATEEHSFLVDLMELMNASYEVESARRGYLITGYEGYLEPYESAARMARSKIADLVARSPRLSPEEASALQLIEQRLAGKLSEIETTIELRRSGSLPTALSLFNSDVGLAYMREIREAADQLRSARLERVGRAFDEWNQSVFSATLHNAVVTLFTVVVIMLLGLLMSREISRRAWVAAELDRQVTQRTAELEDLSRELMRVSEREKSLLSRELHDELGGLLVAMKLDLAALRKTLPPGGDAETRVTRLESSIDAGIDLKRRVIENLRPTLLDNLGLVPALEWLAGEASAQGDIPITVDTTGEEPTLPPEAAIAIFRVVQETVTNLLKHSRARRGSIEVDSDERQLEITIRDDGVGLPADALERNGSHGLKQMRFRMAAIGGEVSVEAVPSGGTVTRIRYPRPT